MVAVEETSPLLVEASCPRKFSIAWSLRGFQCGTKKLTVLPT